jgi:hypothetical protein
MEKFQPTRQWLSMQVRIAEGSGFMSVVVGFAGTRIFMKNSISVISQKIELFITTAVRNSNPK